MKTTGEMDLRPDGPASRDTGSERTDEMARSTKTEAALAGLNDLDNLQRKIRKSDNTRRRVPGATVNDDTSSALAELETPAQIGARAVAAGLTVEDVIRRGSSAPNFGQFRMVIGNLIRGIEDRLDEFNGDRSLAAYPKAARRAAREATKAAKARTVGKKTSKKTASKPAIRATKKTGKKTAKRSKAA